MPVPGGARVQCARHQSARLRERPVHRQGRGECAWGERAESTARRARARRAARHTARWTRIARAQSAGGPRAQALAAALCVPAVHTSCGARWTPCVRCGCAPRGTCTCRWLRARPIARGLGVDACARAWLPLLPPGNTPCLRPFGGCRTTCGCGWRNSGPRRSRKRRGACTSPRLIRVCNAGTIPGIAVASGCPTRPPPDGCAAPTPTPAPALLARDLSEWSAEWHHCLANVPWQQRKRGGEAAQAPTERPAHGNASPGRGRGEAGRQGREPHHLRASVCMRWQRMGKNAGDKLSAQQP